MSRPMRRSAGLFLAALLATPALPGAAYAGPEPGAVDPDTEVAQRHFRLGIELYAQERYLEAIEQFQRAKLARPSAAFEYNIGRAHDRLGNWQAALAGYERYLAMARNPTDAAEVRARIEQLHARIREASPQLPDPRPPDPPPVVAPVAPQTPVTPVAPVTSSRPAPTPLSIAAPSVVAGLFVLSVGSGAALYGLVGRDVGRLQDRCAPSCDRAEVDGLRRREAASFALLGIAGAALVVDVALWTVWAKRRPRR